MSIIALLSQERQNTMPKFNNTPQTFKLKHSTSMIYFQGFPEVFQHHSLIYVPDSPQQQPVIAGIPAIVILVAWQVNPVGHAPIIPGVHCLGPALDPVSTYGLPPSGHLSAMINYAEFDNITHGYTVSAVSFHSANSYLIGV